MQTTLGNKMREKAPVCSFRGFFFNIVDLGVEGGELVKIIKRFVSLVNVYEH